MAGGEGGERRRWMEGDEERNEVGGSSETKKRGFS